MKKIIFTIISFFLLCSVAFGAQILLINSESADDGYKYVGDILDMSVKPDDWVPNETYQEKCNILQVNGSVEDVLARFAQLRPVIVQAYLLTSTGKYSFIDDGTSALTIDVTPYGNKWYKVENDFDLPLTVSELTAEEKQVLETVDINHPSVDSFINKIQKDIFSLSGNDVEVVDLKNQEPPQ